MTQISQEAVLAALRTVQDPDLRQDLVTLNMIRDLEIQPEQGTVSVRVVLTTPACPMKAKIESDVRAALMSVSGVRTANIKMDSEVRRRVGAGGPQSPQTIEGVTHIIAVSSGKGGVGKSTVSVNLATSLALEGARVGLMDADIYGPNVPTMMGVTDEPMMMNHPQKGEVFVPPTAHGVKVMSMGFLVHGDQPVVWRGPMLHSIVNQFCYKVDWGQLDYLIIDMPPGTGDVQLSIAQLVPVSGAVLVTTPQEVSIQDVRKAFNMFEKVRIPIAGIVENMSYFVCDDCTKKHVLFGSGGGKALAEKFRSELIAQVPMVPSVCQGGDEGKPVVVRDPNSEVAKVFRDMAKKVAQQVSILSNSQASGQSPGISGGSPQFVQIGKFS